MNTPTVALMFVAVFIVICGVARLITSASDAELELNTSYEKDRLAKLQDVIQRQQSEAHQRYQAKVQAELQAHLGNAQSQMQNMQNRMNQAANSYSQQDLGYLQQLMQGTISTSWTTAPATPVKELPRSEQAEVVIAWRAWKVYRIGSKPILQSVVAKTLWPWGEPLEADGFGKQQGTHGRGIYAAKTKIGGVEATSDWKGCVFGKVALWGKVIEHERGYRAQFAYPQHLWCEDGATAQELRRLYGIEVSTE